MAQELLACGASYTLACAGVSLFLGDLPALSDIHEHRSMYTVRGHGCSGRRSKCHNMWTVTCKQSMCIAGVLCFWRLKGFTTVRQDKELISISTPERQRKKAVHWLNMNNLPIKHWSQFMSMKHAHKQKGHGSRKVSSHSPWAGLAGEAKEGISVAQVSSPSPSSVH